MQQTHDHQNPGAFTNSLQELSTEQLRELTDYLEHRLSTMGVDGDCAYERALTTIYHQLLDKLHERLGSTKARA